MKVDRKKLEHSIRGEYRFKKILGFIYTPLAKEIGFISLKTGINSAVLLLLGILLIFISSYIIIFAPKFSAIAGTMVFLSFVLDIAYDAVCRYNGKKEARHNLIEENNHQIRIFLIFFSATYYIFNTTDNSTIFILFAFAIFIFMLMNFSNLVIKISKKEAGTKGDVIEDWKRSLSSKIKIKRRFVGFGFEYQWSLIILLIIFRQFLPLLIIFLALWTFRWLAYYFVPLERLGEEGEKEVLIEKYI